MASAGREPAKNRKGDAERGGQDRSLAQRDEQRGSRDHSEKKKKATSKNSTSAQYQLKQVIGRGSYGIVYKAINKKTAEVVAIKEINYGNDEELNEIMTEIDLLKNLNHVNIVKYHGFIQKLSNLYIILEFASHGSLKNLMATKPNKCLDELETKTYIRQTLHGLIYLHEQGVIHRDIKAANLLLDSDNIVKLADFGVSTKVNNTAMTLAGSLNWMAPEIITNKGASTLSDIWSLGATVVELMTGKPPFHNLLDINIYYAMENEDEKYYPPDSLPKMAQQFLELCFQKNMFNRPTAKTLLNHPWLADANEGKDRLSRFKETFDEEDFNWDDDFQQKEVDKVLNSQRGSPKRNLINSSPIRRSPFKKNSGLLNIKNNNNNNNFEKQSNTSSPKKLNNFNNNHNASLFPLNRNNINTDENYYVNDDDNYGDIDDSLLYDGHYYIERIENGDFELPNNKIKMIVNDCDIDDIINMLINILQEYTEKNSKLLKLLQDFFHYDYKHLSSQILNKFIGYGGLSLILDKHSLISFLLLEANNPNMHNLFDDLFKSGIMYNKIIGKYTNTSPSLYFELIYKYLDYTSVKFWYYWCSKHLNLKFLVDTIDGAENNERTNYNDLKRAQSILLKLSAFDSNIIAGANRWAFERLLPLLIKIKPNKSSQINYIVLKSITYLLQTPNNNHLNSASNLESKPATEISSPSGTVSMTPGLNSPIKIQQRIISNPHFKTFRYEYNDSPFELESQVELPPDFCEGISLYFDDRYINLINTIASNNNIHVWKYLVKVCYIASKFDKNIIQSLYCNRNFLDLINTILSQYSPSNNKTLKQDQKNLKSIIQTLLLIFVDISRLQHKKYGPSIELTNVVITILKTHKEFIPLSVEYLTNELTKEDDTDSSNTRISMANLASAFYAFDANDINFNSMLNQFIKLCSPIEENDNSNNTNTKNFNINIDTKSNNNFNISQENSIEFSKEIIENKDFVSRVKLFFKLYENSLLVQIELLKFIKLLFSNWNHDPTTLSEISYFINNNWRSHDANSRQVGRDSILIIQLCKEIERMKL